MLKSPLLQEKKNMFNTIKKYRRNFLMLIKMTKIFF